MTPRRLRAGAFLIAALIATLAIPAAAQDQAASKSEPLAKELAKLMADKQLVYGAARTNVADEFVAVLSIASTELLVVGAKYKEPILLNERLAKKDYQEAYIDLNSASVPGTKVFVEDLGADGIHFKGDSAHPFDIYEAGDRRTVLDGDWKKQKLTEEEYAKIFAAADERYARMLGALLAELKK